MKSRRKNILWYFPVMLAAFTVLGPWPAVSDSLKGAAEMLLDQRSRSDSQFKTAGSTPAKVTTSKHKSAKSDVFSSASVWAPNRKITCPLGKTVRISIVFLLTMNGQVQARSPCSSPVRSALNFLVYRFF